MERFFILLITMLCSLSMVDHLFAGEVDFLAAQNFVVERSPQSLGVSDFNNDGILDLAVANISSSNVAILLGHGDGTFERPQYYSVGFRPISITVGDFNGDEIPDLATADFGSGVVSSTVSILLGQGDGTFQEGEKLEVQVSPYSIIAGDFDNDDYQDLVVSNWHSNTISVLLGKGNGTFQPARNFTLSQGGARSIIAGDFNGDHILDLATAATGASITSILLGRGDGTFQETQNYQSRFYPVFITTADLNGDAILDLITVNEQSDSIAVFLGQGDGTFQEARYFAVSPFPSAVTVSDFNGDSIPDLAITNSGGGAVYPSTVSILLGNGDGTFRSAGRLVVGNTAWSITADDFNMDGRPDLAVANAGSNTISILINSTAAP